MNEIIRAQGLIQATLILISRYFRNEQIKNEIAQFVGQKYRSIDQRAVFMLSAIKLTYWNRFVSIVGMG